MSSTQTRYCKEGYAQDRCEDEANWRMVDLEPLAARLGLDPSDLEELVDLIVKVVAEGKKL